MSIKSKALRFKLLKMRLTILSLTCGNLEVKSERTCEIL